MTPSNGAATSRLRILHVIIVLGETNGQYNEHCLPLVGVRDLAICTYFEPKLIPPAEIGMFPGDGTVRGFLRALAGAIRGDGYDIVHAHAPATGALVLIALALRPRRWRVRTSLVYTVQDSFYDYKLRDKLLMLPVFGGFRRIVFCGRAARDSYPGMWRRLVGRRGRIVPNAADLGRIDRAIAQVPLDPRNGTFDIVSVGRLEKVKDPLAVLAAFRQIEDPGSRLTFIGAGGLEPRLAEEIRTSGLEQRVERTGLIPRDDVFVRCAAADLFVSASHGEGLPVAVIEAMASGCPVVISDIPPHRELADGADFVTFVPSGDAVALAHEIERYRAMPLAERRAIGRQCQELAHARFGLATMHDRLEAVYRELG